MEKRVAIFIDAENVQSKSIITILDKLKSRGNITVKRIYADWTQQKNNSWKDQLNQYAIKPIQKFAYTTDKGSSDTALIIDVMDLLHAKVADIFCIVSSDSDYTGLAHRIREDGLMVIGAGYSHTPKAFIASCNDFIYLDIEKQEIIKQNSPLVIKPINYEIVYKAFEKSKMSNDGAVLQSRFKESLTKIDPNFKQKDYGFKKFTDFCKALKGYTLVSYSDRSTFSVKKK